MKTIKKYWKAPLQKTQIQTINWTTTASDCVARKIRMTEIQLKAAFEKESKLFLSEFQKPDCFRSSNCPVHVCDVMKRHLDVLFANCAKNYIHHF